MTVTKNTIIAEILNNDPTRSEETRLNSSHPK